MASHRGAPLAHSSVVLDAYATIGQSRWAAWLRKERLADRVPLDFAAVLAEIEAFADPVLDGPAAGKWVRALRRWA